MRHTLFWKEMRELSQVLGVLVSLEILLVLAVRLLPAGTVPGSSPFWIFFCAVVALGASLCARDRRPGMIPFLSSLPVPRGRILAARLAAGLVSLACVALGGVTVLWLAVRWGWAWTPALLPVREMALLAALGGLGAAAWWLRARFELRPASRASGQPAPGLLAVEWRQKRAVLGVLTLLPLLSLAGAETPESASFSVFSWGWLGGALVGAALFTARERDGSRFLLYVLPIARRRLVAGRLLAGVAFGGLYLAECLLVFRAGGHVFIAGELSSAILMFVFFYGSAFLTGAALSPWLRSTVVAALLALISTYLLTMIFSWSGPWMDRLSGAWAGTGILLAVLSAAAGWSTVRSRAFEPSPRKDLRVLLTVLALWLAAAGILSIF